MISDLDLMIVPGDFGRMPAPDRATFLIKSIIRKTEIFCHAKEDFEWETRSIRVVREVLKGVTLS